MAKSSKTEKMSRASGGSAEAESRNQTPAHEIDRLGTMRINELQALYAEVTGKSTRCPNRVWLVKSILDVAEPAPVDESPEAQDMAGEALASGGDVEAVAPFENAIDLMPTTANAETGDAASPSSESPLPVDALAFPTDPFAAADLSRLSIPELQARYADVLGRATASSNRGYLVYKLRSAQKGGAAASPRPRHQKTGDDLMVLPLRMEADLVDQLDAAWRRQGLRSRMDLFRRSLAAYLAGVGETDVASRLASDA